MTTESKLMGFVRRSRNGGALKVSVNQNAFESAEKYQTSDGTEYVGMIINLNRLRNLLNGEQEVTAINQIVESAPQEKAS
jgi:hypothetical protein